MKNNELYESIINKIADKTKKVINEDLLYSNGTISSSDQDLHQFIHVCDHLLKGDYGKYDKNFYLVQLAKSCHACFGFVEDPINIDELIEPLCLMVIVKEDMEKLKKLKEIIIQQAIRKMGLIDGVKELKDF